MPVTTIRGGRQITDGTIPYADIQAVTASRLLGNPTGSAATMSEISLGTGLAFSGASVVLSANLQSLSALNYSSAAFVKMTAAGTFGLDTNQYALTTHKYHQFTDQAYYFDVYDQVNFLRVFTENSVYDTTRFQPFQDVEYWNGTAWTAWSGSTTIIQNLLDGRQETEAAIDHTHRKFRFTVTTNSGGWPTLALIMLQSSWSAITYPSMTVTVETSTTVSGGTWTLKETCVFSSANTGNNWGLHMKASYNLHNGEQYNRITIDITDWTDSTTYTTAPLRNFSIYSNYSGSAQQPWSWAYDKSVTFLGAIKKSGGTSAQFLKADGSVDSTAYTANTGTVTSVALTTGTSGTDVNVSGSPVTGSGTITLNIPDASTTARGLMTITSQTFTGTKAFNNTVFLNNADNIANHLAIKSGTSGYSYSTTGYVSLTSSAADNLTVSFQGATKVANFLGSSLSAARTYTLPNASGTLALTSDISTNYQAPLNGTGFVRMSGTTVSYITGTSTQFVKADGSLDGNAYSLTSHTHYIGTTAVQSSSASQALTGITGITFVAEGSDAASITSTVSSTSTFFDFNLADDNNNDEWRWRFTPSGTSVYNAMRLVPVSNTASNLIVSGTITGSQIIRSGGTSSQFLKADGSVDSTAYGTGTVTSVSGTGTVSGLTLTGTVTGSGSLTLGGTLSLTSGNVTTALGYTPYNSTNPSGYITSAQTYYIGTTQNALNRSSATQTLTGISIDGNAATATRLNATSISNVSTGRSVGSLEYYDVDSATGAPTTGWYSYISLRHGNSANQNGFQLAYNFGGSTIYFRGWDGSNPLSWYTLLHSGNISSYAITSLSGETLQAVMDRGASSSTFITLTGGGVFNSNIYSFRNTLGSGVYLGSTTAVRLQAYSDDGGAAYMTFHRSNSWAVNMGLDPDNVFRIGGYSASANRLQLDMSGNLTVAGDVSPWGHIYISNDSSPNTKTIRFGDNTGWVFRFQTSVSSTWTTRFSFKDDGTFTAVGDVIAYSDARVKTNVATITDPLDKVTRMRGVTYNRTDNTDASEKVGVIAQEMQQVLPQVVSEDKDGMLGVSYGNLAGVFIEAIKEQQKQIEDLQKQIKYLVENR